MDVYVSLVYFQQSKKRLLDALELELQTIVKYNVNAWDPTPLQE